ncbi:MAG: aldehyde dehydrogenase family protein, partial [Pseudomonadales bacterium]|nr:aldehyde dehydrogenase family protein [Pseudomonadales bacterium]
KETGAACIDQRPAKVFFTGSCRGGSAVMAHAAQYLIPVELELGGKDPMVIFDDVDLERAVNGAVWGGMTNSGQTCTAVERILVQDTLYPKFIDMLKEKLENIQTPSRCQSDDPNDLDVGCMTAQFQVDIVMEQIEDARNKGADIITGGKRIGQSNEIEPTVITGITDEMLIAREETFGPVVTVQSFSDEAQAIHMANDTPYGLSASVWSADLNRAERIARAIETGNVSINNLSRIVQTRSRISPSILAKFLGATELCTVRR